MFISPIRKKGLYSNGEIDRPASIVDWDWRHACLLRDPANPPRICPGITRLPASLKSWMEDLEWLEHQPLRSKVSVGFSLGVMMFWYVLHVSYRIKHWEGFLELVQSMSGNLKTFFFWGGGLKATQMKILTSQIRFNAARILMHLSFLEHHVERLPKYPSVI